jgi:hypothetical protein
MTDPQNPATPSTAAAPAIYIDFETLRTDPPHPALLGVLVGSDGEELEQLILDPKLAPAQRAKPQRTRVVAAADAVDTILNLAQIDDGPIVGWSYFDRDRLIEARPDLAREISERYVNALQTARRWRQKVHPGFSVEPADPFSPRHTLDRYARLAGYRDLRKLETGKPATWIRHALKGLAANDGRYRRITPEAKRDWHRLLEYNRHDLLALRQIFLTATRELQLWRAYEQTRFCVDAGRRRICFVAGSRSRRLDALLERTGTRSWAFITAWNPGSRALSAEENAQRHSQLLQAVDALGLAWLPGEGVGADPSWTPEQSIMILNITRAQATGLGRQFEQLAIVAGRRGEAASLLSTG